MHRRHPVAKRDIALGLRDLDRAKSKRTPQTTVHRTRSRAIELKAITPLSSRNEASASTITVPGTSRLFPSRDRNHRDIIVLSMQLWGREFVDIHRNDSVRFRSRRSSRRSRGRRRLSGYRTVTRRRAAERGHARARVSILIRARRRGASIRVELAAPSLRWPDR